VLDDIPALVLSKKESERIKQGQKLELNSLDNLDHFLTHYPNYSEFEKIYATIENDPVALIRIDNGIIKPARIINF
jgi:hypothetical protein